MAEPIITCIEDLRVLAKRRVPRMFYDYADSGAWTESTYRANETDFQRIYLRQRVGIDFSNRTLASTMVGQPVSMPMALAPGRPHRHAACGRRDPGGTRRRCSRRTVHALDHEHLLHRGRGGKYGQAVLVSALRDEGSRFQRSPDRTRQGGRLLGAGAHARSADPGPAPQGPQERPHRAAEDDAGQHCRHRHQAALVDGHARHQAAHLPQHRRPRAGREGHARARGLDRRAVRSDAELGRREAHQGPLGRQADPEGHSRSRGRRAGGRAAAPTR